MPGQGQVRGPGRRRALPEGAEKVKDKLLRLLESGEQLKVGDVIVHKHCFGGGKYRVHRVSKKYAFVKYNDVAEGKYPIVFDMRFESLPRKTWGTTTYSVIRQGRRRTWAKKKEDKK
jgi:hypothetical protein